MPKFLPILMGIIRNRSRKTRKPHHDPHTQPRQHSLNPNSPRSTRRRSLRCTSRSTPRSPRAARTRPSLTRTRSLRVRSTRSPIQAHIRLIAQNIAHARLQARRQARRLRVVSQELVDAERLGLGAVGGGHGFDIGRGVPVDAFLGAVELFAVGASTIQPH